ncbi:MAG: hypothetical protein AAF990_15570 [Bacteroidota bacterium]
MKKLLFLLWGALAALMLLDCESKDKKTCSPINYAFNLSVSNNLQAGPIQVGEDLELKIRFAKELVDINSQAAIGVEGLAIRSALILKDYTHDKGELSQYPSAKLDFDVDVVEGSQLTLADDHPTLQNNETILFEPSLNGDFYTLSLVLRPKRAGIFYFYWRDGNTNEQNTALFPQNGLECEGRYSFSFDNISVNNFNLFDQNQFLSTRRDLISSSGILAVKVE